MTFESITSGSVNALFNFFVLIFYRQKDESINETYNVLKNIKLLQPLFVIPIIKKHQQCHSQKPDSYCITFIGKVIICNIWIDYDFLKKTSGYKFISNSNFPFKLNKKPKSAPLS